MLGSLAQLSGRHGPAPSTSRAVHHDSRCAFRFTASSRPPRRRLYGRRWVSTSVLDDESAGAPGIDEAAADMDPMLVEKDTGRFLLERAIVPQEQVDLILSQFHFFPMVGRGRSGLRSGQNQMWFQMRAEPASAMYGAFPVWMHGFSTCCVSSLFYSTL